MTRTPLTGRRGGPYLIALAVFLACFLLFVPLSSAAEAENAAALSDDELAELVETLEDPAERERFLGDLKALLEARAALGENGESTSAGASALKNISDGLEHVGGELVRFAKGLADIPEAARWLGDEWSAAESRDIWTEMVWKLAVVIGGGIIAAFIFSFGLRRVSPA